MNLLYHYYLFQKDYIRVKMIKMLNNFIHFKLLYCKVL